MNEYEKMKGIVKLRNSLLAKNIELFSKPSHPKPSNGHTFPRGIKRTSTSTAQSTNATTLPNSSVDTPPPQKKTMAVNHRDPLAIRVHDQLLVSKSNEPSIPLLSNAKLIVDTPTPVVNIATEVITIDDDDD